LSRKEIKTELTLPQQSTAKPDEQSNQDKSTNEIAPEDKKYDFQDLSLQFASALKTLKIQTKRQG